MVRIVDGRLLAILRGLLVELGFALITCGVLGVRQIDKLIAALLRVRDPRVSVWNQFTQVVVVGLRVVEVVVDVVVGKVVW